MGFIQGVRLMAWTTRHKMSNSGNHWVPLAYRALLGSVKFVNSAKSYTVDSTTLARIENKKVIIVVANTTPLLTFSIMYLIFFFIVFFYPKITA